MEITKEYNIDECGGERRYGGVFTFGPVKWEKCKNKPIVIIQIQHKNKQTENIPACLECWKECIENKLKILKVELIIIDK